MPSFSYKGWDMSALRDTDGKLNWVLLFEHFPLALKELCRAREFGARHYTKDGKDGATNWRESINGSEHDKFYKGCIRGNMSHNLKPLWGEDRDAVQDNVHHLAFGALNDLMALEYALAKELDDEGHAVPEGEPTRRTCSSYSDSEGALVVRNVGKLEVETAPNSGEFESWDKIISDKIDALYQWPEDPQYVYATFSSYGEIFYTSVPPKIEGEQIFYIGGLIDTTDKMAPLELRPHWKVSVRKRPVKKTIYDWSDIPDQYKWIAKDKDEKVFMFAEKPELGDETWHSGCLNIHDCTQTTDEPWWTSLEARPT